MFHVYSSCISNMKNIIERQYLTKESVSCKYRVEPESKNSNVDDIFNWLGIVRNVIPSFLLQKEGVPRKRGGSNPGGKYACNQETFRQFEACIRDVTCLVSQNQQLTK